MLKFARNECAPLNIGNKIHILRIETGIKQIDLANILGITKATMSNYERCQTTPDLEMLVKIANLFNVSVDFILDHDTSYFLFKNNSDSDFYNLDRKNVLTYYDRLDDEDKNYIKGLMIQLFREKTEQKKNKKIIG